MHERNVAHSFRRGEKYTKIDIACGDHFVFDQ